MAEDIRIQLQDIFQDITEDDIRKGKRFVLRREQAARGVASLVDTLLEGAAEKITLIAYRYGIDPMRFQISSAYNEEMMKEIASVLDELEDEILDLTLSYSTKCTEDKERKNMLLLWVLALGRNNQGLAKTLEQRLRMFAKDLEAMIVAAKSAGHNATMAVQRIKSFLHAAYTMPEMKPLFRNSQMYAATYIRSRGVKYGNQGNSNSEANNIGRFSRMTVQMAWMHYRQETFEDNGAVGYMCFRGSSFPCSLCDEICGIVHPIDGPMVLPRHPNCACYAVPIFIKDIQESLI